ncbi:PREDICTED: proline-rich protein PRCC-like [Polistes dominula]|uniref:Proline-rich protein PRCC-like n=1 Tax=Polistes dominula TaxID=743375 RepID=A0ABM1J2S2_POLDO|nr:PREDICTED: proline-rich protein PRCC-like [Polistes dominula]
MSLVAYDSSDNNSENEEDNSTEVNNSKNEITSLTNFVNKDLHLSESKYQTNVKLSVNNESLSKINWNVLPRPKNTESEQINLKDVEEEEDDEVGKIAVKKEVGKIAVKKEVGQDKRPTKKPVKIMIRSLCEFKDLDEEDMKKQSKVTSIDKGSGLFSLLPPPKVLEQKVKKPLIPNIVTKSQKVLTSTTTKKVVLPNDKSIKSNNKTNLEDGAESDTSETDNHESGIDFFALNTIDSVPDTEFSNVQNTESRNFASMPKQLNGFKMIDNTSVNSVIDDNNIKEYVPNSNLTLTSNIINLPRDEILIKNKAEVGPKLPIPEQEYNVDAEGNVAFDEKAIEYLCGKRGIKRKNKEVEEANIIEISGDDIKPDEREWLVKALTEDPVERPVSMKSSGINFQSKKKHQITYLAHQAKAMEVELKNQWAVNRMTRKQTQSKYGF